MNAVTCPFLLVDAANFAARLVNVEGKPGGGAVLYCTSCPVRVIFLERCCYEDANHNRSFEDLPQFGAVYRRRGYGALWENSGFQAPRVQRGTPAAREPTGLLH